MNADRRNATKSASFWPPLRGLVFDLDGTLVDSRLDFAAIRQDLAVPDGVGVLEMLEQMDGPEAARAWEILHRHEMTGAEAAVPMPGAFELLRRLQSRGIKLAVLTRNSQAAAKRACERVGLKVPLLLTREDAPPKPNPEGILRACRIWGMSPREVAIVGDFHYDLDTARNAGCRGVLYLGGRDPAGLSYAPTADLWLDCFTRPDELLAWLGPAGSTLK